MTSPGARTVNGRILAALDAHAGATCFRVWRANRYRDVSYRHLRRQTLRLVRSFHQRGLLGERLAIWASCTPEWMVAHSAALLAGMVTVPVRRSLPATAALRFLLDSESRWVAVQDGRDAVRLTDASDELPHLEGVLILGDIDSESAEACGASSLEVVTLGAWVGERLAKEDENLLCEQALAVAPEALATLRYTTGPDGSPLGAVFDQGQLAAALDSMDGWLETEADDVALTVLPFDYAPSFDASLQYLVSGVPNVLARSRDLVFEDLQQVSPTLVMTIPSALERAYEEVIERQIRSLPSSSQEIFQWALTTGKQLRAAGSAASVELRDRHGRADRTFFSGIRGAFGGRFRYLMCTGAPLRRSLAESLHTIGLPPVNAYSISEAVGFPAVNPPDSNRPDGCGPATEDFDLSLSSDGEVLIQSRLVMRKYWRRDDETTRVLSPGEALSGGEPEVRLRTGDYGRLDDAGRLFLTGRSGESLLLSTGRRVDPVPLEKRLTDSPFVNQAAVLGEGRPYVVALVVPNLAALTDQLKAETDESVDLDPSDIEASKGASQVGQARGGEVQVGGVHGGEMHSGEMHSDEVHSDEVTWFWQADRDTGKSLTTQAPVPVRALFDRLISDINERFDETERIQRYCLVAQRLSPEADRLGEVLTQNRRQLSQQFAEQLRSMYPTEVETSDREITQVRVGPERLRELLEKESILDAWSSDAGIGFLLDLARRHHIDTPSVIHICDAAANVAQMKSEEKPLSTAFIVGDPMRIHRLLPSSLIQLHRHEHIRRMRARVTQLATLVDGLVLAYVLDRHGIVRGICRLDLDLREAPLELFGPRFRLHAEVSRRSDSVVFFVPKGGGQVRIFAQGELVGRYANGDWMSERASLFSETLTELAREELYDSDLVGRLLRCAFRMSEENHGAIFLLGDADRILAKSDSPEISHFAWISSAPVSSLSDEELINFAKQDGATVIDAETKRFRSCMVLLRPDAGTRAEVGGGGKGARHSSAAKMSAEAQAMAITVSQDGPITVYDRGKRVLAL